MNKLTTLYNTEIKRKIAEIHGAHALRSITGLENFLSNHIRYGKSYTIKNYIHKTAGFYGVSVEQSRGVYYFKPSKFSGGPTLKYYNKTKILQWLGDVYPIEHLAFLAVYIRKISTWQGRIEFLHKQYISDIRTIELKTALDLVNQEYETKIEFPLKPKDIKVSVNPFSEHFKSKLLRSKAGAVLSTDGAS